jgi:two-component system, chemotaxis family, response regulator Rcp1
MSTEIDGGRMAEILLVEDNQNDVILTEQAFRKAKCTVNLRHVGDGVDCMKYLRKEAPYTEAETPDLILLDLNLPRKDGREVMAEVSADPELRQVPVVILTTSSHEEEILAMYDLRCSSYIIKPVDFTQFQRVISIINEYWFTVVVLPKR